MIQSRLALIFGLILVTLGCSGRSGTAGSDAQAEQPLDASADLPIVPDIPADLALDVAPDLMPDVPTEVSVSDDGGDVPADLALDLADSNSCPAPQMLCGGTCVDLSASTANCGSCGTDCRSLPGIDASRVTCVHGACDLGSACLAGRGNCDGNAMNGCETDLSTTTNCGTCGAVCMGATPMCAMVASDAGVSRACSSGCTSMTPTRCDGTCVDTQTDPSNCGTCGHACSTALGPPGTTNACVAGACTPVCLPGRGDCDGNTANGCETDTRSNTSHCGMCGNACPESPTSAPSCIGGICAPACPAGQHRCFGVCQTEDGNSCGRDCRECPWSGPPYTPICTAGVCGEDCLPGNHRCTPGGSCVPADAYSCGPSCTRCPTHPGALPACDGTNCILSCLAPLVA